MPTEPREYLTISQVCRRLPGARGAPNVTPSTVTRWILAGCPARNGARVKLRATRAGGRWLVDPADLSAFFEALAVTDSAPGLPPVRAASANARATERAIEELKRRGA